MGTSLGGKKRRAAFAVIAAVLAGLLLIQAVPYGRDHTNSPVLAEPQWDSPRTRELAVKACFDCHSNETRWPWYSNIAPLSWQTQDHVDEGREKLNFSQWGFGEQESDDIVESFQDGEMPPATYKLRFWDRLSGTEKEELLAGLIATFGTGGGGRD
jgi:hypothetical protein